MSSLPPEFSFPAGGFRADARFGTATGLDLAPRRPDPAESAFSEGYAQGLEEGLAQAQAQAALDDAARARIELGFGKLAEAEERRLEERLRETVLVLCERTLAPLTVDPDALAGRISRALDMLRRSEDQRVLRIHPADLVLIQGRLPEGLRVEPDPALERGELRVETPEGGVEDGPSHWRRTLSEALGL